MKLELCNEIDNGLHNKKTEPWPGPSDAFYGSTSRTTSSATNASDLIRAVRQHLNDPHPSRTLARNAHRNRSGRIPARDCAEALHALTWLTPNPEFGLSAYGL